MNFDEILIIIGIALVVIGPQRLPEYAEQLGRLVRNLRNMATGASETIREELGDEFADLDLTKFDPRQYDPRRIVREALLEDVVPATKPARAPARTASAQTKPVSAKAPAATSTSARTKRITESTSMGKVAPPAAKDAVVADAPVEDATADAPVEETPVEGTAPEVTADAPATETAAGDTEGDAVADVPVTVGAPFDDEAT